MRGDWLFAGGLGLILLTGLLVEGARIRAANFPPFELWSPAGWVIGRFFEVVGMTAPVAFTLHTVLWWVHALLALAFVAYLPYSKSMHMLADGVNLLAHDRTATLALPAQVPDTGHAGYTKIEDFTWKELLDFDACTKCGRCHEVCPARTAGAPLSPRDLILDLRQWVDEQSGGLAVLDREQRSVKPGADAVIAGDVIKARTLWSCTTCMACVQTCPVGIEHVPTIVQLRRTLVEEGNMDNSLQQALQNLAGQGNSFGKSARMRSRWTKKLESPIKDARKEPVKYLWFVGDYASYDDRLAENSRLLARLLTEAGVDFGILYEDEWNSGNDVRRVGEEGLYEQLAEHNIEALRAADFEEIFTTDPHSLNALRNEYPKLGAKYTVWHYTEVLAHLIETGAHPGAAAAAAGHLPRPVLSGPLQRRDRGSPADPVGAGLRTGRDATQPVQHLLLRRRRRADLDGRLVPRRAPQREQDQGGGEPRRHALRGVLPQGHDDVLRRGQDHRPRRQAHGPGHHSAGRDRGRPAGERTAGGGCPGMTGPEHATTSAPDLEVLGGALGQRVRDVAAAVRRLDGLAVGGSGPRRPSRCARMCASSCCGRCG